MTQATQTQSTQTQTTQPKPAREYKSRVFVMIFRDKKELLGLYNAVSGRNYEDPELLTITTLENALYMSVKNDLSFIIDSRLSLYEHQSTHNPNMPLRFLIYLADIYSGLVKDKNIYGTKVIPLPAPQFIVFYNGEMTRPDHEVLKLSDAYLAKDRRISLELIVDVLNVNVEHNKELLKACRTLGDYAEYVSRIRKYAKTMSIEEAVETTIDECIQEGILGEFLKQNRAEAKSMSIYEYNEEEHLRMERESAYEDGREQERKNTERERQNAERERLRADAAEQRAENERLRADGAEQKAKNEKLRAEAAEAELKELKAKYEKLKI